MSFFKFLQRGAISPLTGFQWQPGTWVTARGPLAVCGNGAHVLRPQQLAYWLHEELWRAEVDGEQIEGGDCLVARRVRLTDRIDGWSNGDGLRFAQACLDRLRARMADATDPKLREHFANYDWAVGWHVEHGNLALAGYVSALGTAQVAGALAEPGSGLNVGTPVDCFRRERDWQSAWLIRELRLG
ncbi:MAG TPA: hypothetical protein VHH90_09100 [Polyangia bacterium]|nr:hypothetical protein [Polyangia bacterium]